MMHTTVHDVRMLLHMAVDRAGGEQAFADKHHMSRSYVRDAMSGRRLPGYKILAALGLRREIIYYKRSSAA